MAKRPNRHRQSHVVLAYVRSQQVEGAFTDSLLEVKEYDAVQQDYLNPYEGGGRIVIQTSPRIAEARSQIIDEYLRPQQFPKADWLWWVDTDATFGPDTLAALMEVADAEKRPIVGALAFAGARAENMYPTLYGLEEEEDGEVYITKAEDYPPDALVQVAGTGCHCVLVHRSVFVAMHSAFAKLPNGKPNPYPWYAEGHIDARGIPIGEDMIFCRRAHALGFSTFVHTGIKTGHIKQQILDEALWRRQHPLPEPLRVVS